MGYIIFLIVFVLNLYWTKTRPGVVLTYLIFFQSMNKYLFDTAGLSDYRYITAILFIPLIVVFHYRKSVFFQNVHVFFSNKIIWGYILLVFYMLGYSYVNNYSFEIDYTISFLFPGVLLLFIGGVFFFNENMYKDLIYGFLIFTFILFFSLFLTMGSDFMTIGRPEIRDAIGFGPIYLGRVAALALIITIILLIQKKIPLFSGAILLISYLFLLGLSGTRGALFSGVFTLLVVFYFQFKLKSIPKLFLFSVLFVLLLIIVGFAESTLFERTSELFQPEYIQSMYRYNRYLLFWEALPDYYVFGAGPGGWGRYILIGDVYPHNIVMELVIEYGIIGMISFILITVYGLKLTRFLLTHPKTSAYHTIIPLIWIFFLTSSMFSGNILLNGSFFYSAAILSGLKKHTLNTVE